MAEPSPEFEQIESQVHATRLHFLQVELEVGNTMLDVAANSHDPAVHERRRARARAAHDEVERQLARGDALGLSAPERGELAEALARLRERFDTGS